MAYYETLLIILFSMRFPFRFTFLICLVPLTCHWTSENVSAMLMNNATSQAEYPVTVEKQFTVRQPKKCHYSPNTTLRWLVYCTIAALDISMQNFITDVTIA